MLVSLISTRPLSWTGAEFCQMLIPHLMKWSNGFFSFSLYMMDYVDRFLICWTSPISLGWSLLDHNEWFYVFMDVVCQYFIENFCIDVHEWDWSVILFLGWVFVQFWHQGNYSLLKRVWQWAFCFYCMEHFEEYRNWLFLKVLVEFCTKAIRPFASFGLEVFDDSFYPLAAYSSVYITHLVLI